MRQQVVRMVLLTGRSLRPPEERAQGPPRHVSAVGVDRRDGLPPWRRRRTQRT